MTGYIEVRTASAFVEAQRLGIPCIVFLTKTADEQTAPHTPAPFEASSPAVRAQQWGRADRLRAPAE